MMPPARIAEIHMDPEGPLPYRAEHLVLGQLTPTAIDDLLAAVGPGTGSELLSVEIRHLGGAMGRPAPSHGASARMPGEYLLVGLGVTPDEQAEQAVRARLDPMIEAMRPLAAGLHVNFTEHPVGLTRLFDTVTLRRLHAVRAKVDPTGLFRANHPIPPARRPMRRMARWARHTAAPHRHHRTKLSDRSVLPAAAD
jgi:berberine-like enzyme